MPDSALAALTEDTSPLLTDVLYKVDIAGTVDRKVQVGNLTGARRIASSLLGADAASVVFSSIPATYSGLLIVGLCRQTKAVAAAGFNIRVNNDNGTNYTAGSSFIPAGNVPGASATAGRSGSVVIWIPGYAQTTFHKTVIWQVAYDNIISNGAYGWNSTAAINEVDLIADTNNFLTGSLFELYGLV